MVGDHKRPQRKRPRPVTKYQYRLGESSSAISARWLSQIKIGNAARRKGLASPGSVVPSCA